MGPSISQYSFGGKKRVPTHPGQGKMRLHLEDCVTAPRLRGRAEWPRRGQTGVGAAQGSLSAGRSFSLLNSPSLAFPQMGMGL